MKFYEILKNVILEDARIDVLVDKFLKPIKGKESLLNAEELFALAVADPLTKVDEGIDIDNFDGDWSSVKKTGPYVQWIIKQYLNLKTTDDDGQIIEPDSKLYKEQLKKTKQLFWEDLIKVTQNLRKFDRFKNRLDVEFRNIDKLSIDTLENLVSGFSLEKEKLNVEIMGRGFAWLDTGTHESLMEAASFIATLQKRQGLMVACPEEIAFVQNWIDASALQKLATPLAKNGYGQYLLNLLK